MTITMTEHFDRLARSGRPLLALLLVAGIGALAGCDSPTDPDPVAGTDWGVVLNSVERSLTAFDVADPAVTSTIGLGPSGSPVSVTAWGEIAIVPMGVTPEVAVVDLRAREILHRVALPEGSGASGAAFLNDSIVLVGNPERNTVSPVNFLRGTAGEEIEVGGYPAHLIEAGSTVFVLNAELEGWAPARPGTISVIGQGLTVGATIELSGTNPGAAFWSGNHLFVLNRGSWGAGDGSLSIVHGLTFSEEAHFEGFGDFPGSLAPGVDGLLYVSLYGEGIVAWDPGTATFAIGHDHPLTPGDSPPISHLAVDHEWRMYAANPGTCEAPGAVYRLGASAGVDATIPVGVCPTDIVFTRILDE
jgi:DNA-binding beta-propeller fold protein YncE